MEKIGRDLRQFEAQDMLHFRRAPPPVPPSVVGGGGALRAPPPPGAEDINFVALATMGYDEVGRKEDTIIAFLVTFSRLEYIYCLLGLVNQTTVQWVSFSLFF
jgi:hypothetical protein